MFRVSSVAFLEHTQFIYFQFAELYSRRYHIEKKNENQTQNYKIFSAINPTCARENNWFKMTFGKNECLFRSIRDSPSTYLSVSLTSILVICKVPYIPKTELGKGSQSDYKQ